MPIAIAERFTTVRTPLGDESLTFTHLAGFDEISRCFAFTVGFAAPDLEVDPLALLGRRVSVQAEGSDPERWFDGFVTGFRIVEVEAGLARYEAELRPWLWFLNQGRDCRIFQNLSVVDIIEEVFAAYPDADFEKRLQGSYPPREYCVQYDESDLAFVQRLMEYEGIFYFFEYADGRHTLILADANGALRPPEGHASVPFHREPEAGRRDREYLSAWRPLTSVRPGAYAHTDYDFEKPAADLMARSEAPFAHALAEAEVYSHPGAHLELGRGDAVAALRREALQASHVRVAASGTVRGLAAGAVFALEGFPREDQNAEHVVLRADYRMEDPAWRAGAGGTGDRYRVGLELLPAAIPFRPALRTPRPVMRGPQTATVVGPAGAEIFTDDYARVKVQFHWDRLGRRDENTSCFVRVSQTWAGAGWGFIQIPRIGQEVVVDFIEGDPDKPLITGRVYNAAQMPPYGLPGNETQSGWKSNSSPGGGGYNELMFEDRAGAELVNFQAQKDHHLLIKNDRRKLVQHDQFDRIDNNAEHSVGVNLDEDVGSNKTTKVGVDRKVSIGNDDSETVGHDRSLTVGGNETIGVVGNSTEEIGRIHSQTVGLAQKVLVKAGRTDKVGLAESRVVGGVQTITVGLKRNVRVGSKQAHYVQSDDSTEVKGSQSFKVHKNHASEIGGNQNLTLKGNQTWSIDGDRVVKVGKGQGHDVAGDVGVKAGKAMTLEAADSITLKCGSAMIQLKKDGTILIEGKDITAKGSGKIVVQASGEVTIKGSKINQN